MLYPLRRTAFAALLSAFGGLAQAQPQPALDPAQGVTVLSPFYVPPAELPAEPGRLIRREDLPPALALASAENSSRILYSSTNGVGGGQRIAVSGALYLPKGTPPAGGWPILAWAHGTVGVADVCAASWAGRSARDAAYLNRWLDEGFAIVASDYQGLGVAGLHPYLFTRPEAYSVLDSIRAAISGVPGLNADKIVVVGQSQGGGAAYATAAFWPDYAPDLRLRGVVATGVPYLSLDLAASAAQQDLDRVDPTIAYAFYIAVAAQEFLSPPPSSSSLFTEAALPLFATAPTTCVGPLFRAVENAGLTRRTALKADFIQVLAKLGPELSYPTLKVAIPVFIGTGAEDRDVSAVNQLALVRDSCSAGTPVEAHLYAGLDHGGAVNGSLKDSLPFIRKVLAGERVEPRCNPVPE
ncbi:lipase family protein [Enterovirga sp. CN4-39]|uniref:lipase family protein n=1 Tax=Enterovirga sp. CN4-39 TaxID=3400910 RepID=UPI003C07B05E